MPLEHLGQGIGVQTSKKMDSHILPSVGPQDAKAERTALPELGSAWSSPGWDLVLAHLPRVYFGARKAHQYFLPLLRDQRCGVGDTLFQALSF